MFGDFVVEAIASAATVAMVLVIASATFNTSVRITY